MDDQTHNKPQGLIPADIYPPVTTRPGAPGSSGTQPLPSSTTAGPKHKHKPRLFKFRGEGWRSAVSTVLLFLMAPVIALGIAAFVVQSYQVDGVSMETTLQNDDRLIVDKLPRTLARITGHDYIPARGNIIIFNQSGLPDAGPSGEKQLIKRVIGLPGEHVVIKNGYITIFNKAHPGGFNPDTTTGYHLTNTYTAPDVDLTLGPNQIFVCGDNRTNSEDSRYFGPINASQIVGRLVLRVLPANEIKKF